MVEAIGVEQVRRQEVALRELVGGLDPDAVPLPEVAELWSAFTDVARLASAAGMLLARRVQESAAWQEAGCRSAAEYMARRSGGSVRGCREVVAASKRLAKLPVVAGALHRGELSVAQTELVSGAAAANPEKQGPLVGLAARASLVELGQECLRVKAAADPDPEKTRRRIRRERYLRQRTDAEGAWCLHGRGVAETGALLTHILAPIIDEIYEQAQRDGKEEHRDAYLYDAFEELLNRFLDLEAGAGIEDSFEERLIDNPDDEFRPDGCADTSTSPLPMSRPLAARPTMASRTMEAAPGRRRANLPGRDVVRQVSRRPLVALGEC